VVAERIVGLECDGFAVIENGLIEQVFLAIGGGAADVVGGASGIQSNRFVVVGDRLIDFSPLKAQGCCRGRDEQRR
jgi:hypothetical protein